MVLGAFFRHAPGLSLHFEEGSMSQKEFVFAKKCVLATRDWDTFQVILRTCLKPSSTDPVQKKKAVHRAPQTIAG